MVSSLLQLICCLSSIAPILASINNDDTHMSILGDPGLKFKPYGPRIMLEGWNFCNRAGPSFAGDPVLPSPRYADCIVNNNDNIYNNNSNNCTFGPLKDNCVSIQLNNLTYNNATNMNGTINVDDFAVYKEQMLGDACQTHQLEG